MSTVDPFRAPTDDSFRALWRNQKLLNFKAGLTKGIENASYAEAPRYTRIWIIIVDVVKPDAGQNERKRSAWGTNHFFGSEVISSYTSKRKLVRTDNQSCKREGRVEYPKPGAADK